MKNVALKVVGGSMANGVVRFAVVRDERTGNYGVVAVEEPEWEGARQLALSVDKAELLVWLKGVVTELEITP